MNDLFYDTLRQANNGDFIGLSTGVPILDQKIGGMGRKMMIPIIADSKVGKSSVVDAAFVIEPYLDSIKKGTLFTVDYFSYEMDLVTKMFKFVAYFFMRDYNIMSFVYKDEKILVSDQYLLGRLKTEDGEAIPIQEEHFELISEIYENRIKPMFGEYNAQGKLLTRGCIRFHTARQTADEMMETVFNTAKALGKFYMNGEFIQPQNVINGNTNYFYEPNDRRDVHLVVTDHTRKIARGERQSLKQAMDDWCDWSVKLRNQLGFSFVPICHTNRDMINVQNLRHRQNTLYPTGDDSKDSGNFTEDCNVLISLFNPLDPKYNLTSHFGLAMVGQTCPIPEVIRGWYRTMHIVANRSGEAPVHAAMLVNGANSVIRQYGTLEDNTIVTTQKINFVKPEYGKVGHMDEVLRQYNSAEFTQMNRNEYVPELVYDDVHPLSHYKRWPVVPERMYSPTEIEAMKISTDYINPEYHEQPIAQSPWGGNIYQSDIDQLQPERYHVEANTIFVKPYWVPDDYVYNTRWRDGKKPYFVRPETVELLDAGGGVLSPSDNKDFSIGFEPSVQIPEIDNTQRYNLF